MNEKITTRPDAPDASTPVVVKRFGDYDLALHLDGSVTWRDTGRVPVLPVAPAPAAEDREAEFAWHEAHGPVIPIIGDERYMPVTVARRLAARQSAPLSGVQEDAARRALADAGLDEADAAAAFDALTPWLTRQPAPVVSAEQVREVQYAHIGDDGEHLGPCVLVSNLPALGIEVPRG